MYKGKTWFKGLVLSTLFHRFISVKTGRYLLRRTHILVVRNMSYTDVIHVKKCKCFVYSLSALSYQISSQAPHFHNLKETRTPTSRRQPVGYLQSVEGLNPGQDGIWTGTTASKPNALTTRPRRIPKTTLVKQTVKSINFSGVFTTLLLYKGTLKFLRPEL